MEVLIVGGGGREHALAWKIMQSPLVRRLSVTHDNPGFPASAERAVGDLVNYADLAGVDLVVVGPEAPLAEGLVDRLEERGITVFGPTRAAARLEWSKSFAKEFMARHKIPTAAWTVAESPAMARKAVQGPCVVKADGLAAGKGVFVCPTEEMAHAAIEQVFSGTFGAAGERAVIEELLEGPEISLLALCDGTRAVPLLPCRDYKRRFDRDAGPNTGGMGSICPVPGVGPELIADIQRRVLDPVVRGMAEAGTPFRGVLYAGLMLTRDGPKVLEFNTRFGDPETQPLMMMLDQDLVPLLLGAARGALPTEPIQWKEGGACCVCVVAGDYPSGVAGGAPIRGLPIDDPQVQVFFSGVRREGTKLLATGGRVLGVTAWGPRPAAARVRVYRHLPNIGFQGSDYRKDIAVEVLPETASARQGP